MSDQFPSFELKGQVALVTGAARGLGRAIERALGNAGADVALGLLDVNRDNGLAVELQAMARRALRLQMDMTRIDQVRRAVDDTVTEFGRIDILVNNAGGGFNNLVEDVPEDEFDQTVAQNLKGTFFASQYAGRVMIQQKYGRIINMSSQAGFVALPTESVYCMTKAGIVHLTKCFAVEWGKHNITVNSFSPGFVKTPLWDGLDKDLISAGYRDEPNVAPGSTTLKATPAGTTRPPGLPPAQVRDGDTLLLVSTGQA